MKTETASQYCARIDFEEGEAWSNDYEELANKMQEYAEYYHQAKLKLFGIADVRLSFVDWVEENYPILKNHGGSLTLPELRTAYKQYTNET